jgi:hypothetical protein
MKKISLLVVLASICLAISPASAQTPDTTKNKVEIKKKTKVGVNGRQVTKIKMESKGTPEAINGAVDAAVTGTPSKAATPATPATPATATTSATPAQPANPNVIVVHPEPVTKVVTVPVKTPTTTTRTVTTNVRTSTYKKPATRKTYKPVNASTKTTTTTTIKKD